MALGIFPGTNRKQKKMQGNRRKVNINISNTVFFYYFHVSVKCTFSQNSKKERTQAFQKPKPFCCICTLIQPCQNTICICNVVMDTSFDTAIRCQKRASV